MTGGEHQLIEHPRVGGRTVGGDLDRRPPVLTGAGEELPGGRQISFLGDQNVDDLAELVDGPVQVDPSSRDLGVDTPRGSVVKLR